jgi:hypothetical protein
MYSDNRHKNHVCLVNEDFVIDGKRFVTRLGPDASRDCIYGMLWHATESGELYLLWPSGDEGYELTSHPAPFSKGHDLCTHLAGVQAIADYVREMAAWWMQREKPLSLDLMAFVVWLAIYPGHFSSTDNEAIRRQVLTAFCEGARSAGIELAERRLAQYVLFLATAANAGPRNDFLRYCLTYMPLPFAGVLAAHGMFYKAYWQDRHREVLLEGWRYQLSNPFEPYTDPLEPDSDWTNGDSKCLIEHDITKEDRAFLLSETGLTEEDYATSLGIADATASPNSHEYTQALLMQFAPRSNLRKITKPDVNVTLPPVILE